MVCVGDLLPSHPLRKFLQPIQKHVPTPGRRQHDSLRHLRHSILVHHRARRPPKALFLGYGRTMSEHGSGILLPDSWYPIRRQGSRRGAFHVYR